MEYDMTMIQGSEAATAERRKALLTLVVNINVFFAETLFTLSVKVYLYYHPPMTLREGNVFTHVCSFMGEYDVTSCLVPCSFGGEGGADPPGGDS